MGDMGDTTEEIVEDYKYSQRVENVLNNTGNGRLYVRQQKAEEERRQRDQRKATAKRKRTETLMRKSEPQTKLTKLEKKSKRAKTKLKQQNKVYSENDVKLKHAEILETFAMGMEDPTVKDHSWFKIYMQNYNEWSMAKNQKCFDAMEEDDRYKKKLEREQKKQEERKTINKHKYRMKGVFEEIDENYGRVSKINKDKPKSLSAFFKKAPGFNLTKEQRHYNSIYFSQVVDSKRLVYSFAELDQEEAVSDCENDKPGEYSCDNCKKDMIVDQKMGQLTCPECGFSKQGGFGVGLKQTFSESQASSRTPAPYDRTSHVSSLLALWKPSWYPLLKAIHFICSI